MYRMAYRTVDVNGLSVFYRDAGPQRTIPGSGTATHPRDQV